jgi:acetoin utilization deacetylase AcuC-like enzyme
MVDSVSKSPLKPKLVMEALQNGKLGDKIKVHSDFAPLTQKDYNIAHTDRYVEAFLEGERPLCSSNSIPWSEKLVSTVGYTNASLYNAIKFAVDNPNSLSLSPTSGFHHATPNRGVGFCTFSGQVIGSVKVWRDTGKVGAYVDLDGHYGNSIGDSLAYCDDTSKAIKHNINPDGINDDYIESFEKQLAKLETDILFGKVDYVVWCHGADSHIDDDFAMTAKVDTERWLRCSDIFFDFVVKMRSMGRNVPVVMCLFGGYRADNYDFVIDLHKQDIEKGMEKLL